MKQFYDSEVLCAFVAHVFDTARYFLCYFEALELVMYVDLSYSFVCVIL